MQNPMCVSDEPLVVMLVQFGEFEIRQTLQIDGPFFRPSEHDFEETATTAMAAVVVMTLTQVVPVRNVDAAVGSIFDRHSPKPGIVAEQKVVGMHTDVAGLLGDEPIVVDPIAM